MMDTFSIELGNPEEHTASDFVFDVLAPAYAKLMEIPGVSVKLPPLPDAPPGGIQGAYLGECRILRALDMVCLTKKGARMRMRIDRCVQRNTKKKGGAA